MQQAFLIPILFVAAVSLAGLAYVFIRHSALVGFYRRTAVDIKRDIVYVDGSDNPKHQLDLYLPKGTHNYPLIHFIYGGYWTSGDKRYRQWLTGLYGNIGKNFARRGIGVVVSNYRLAPGVGIDEQLDDVCRAVKWTLTNGKNLSWNGRLYLMGHSAGGHMVSLLAARPDLLAKYQVSANQISGTIALSPVMDIADMAKEHGDSFNRTVTHAVFGDNKKDWDLYSPLQQFLALPAHISPYLLCVGEKDFPFLKQQIPLAADKLKQSGIRLRLLTIKGYNHSDLVVRFGGIGDNLTTEIIDFMHQGNFALDS